MDLDDWDLDADAVEDRKRPGRLLFLLAAAPWLVVAVMLARGAGGPAPAAVDPNTPEPTAVAGARPPSPSDAPAVPTNPPPAGGPLAAPGAAPSEEGAPVSALRFGALAAPGPGHAAAVAAAVARAWLGGAGPTLDVGVGNAGTDAYVEHLVVEAVDLPSSDLAVVTLVAVLLDAEGDAYTGARTVRVAVPVAFVEDRAAPAGQPWWLPPPRLDPLEPPWQPLEDPGLLAEAGAALEDVGYGDVEVVTLARTDGWPLQVTARAVAPGATETAEHRLWLREHLGTLAVAGTIPQP